MWVWFLPDPKGFCLSRYTEAELSEIGVKFDV